MAGLRLQIGVNGNRAATGERRSPRDAEVYGNSAFFAIGDAWSAWELVCKVTAVSAPHRCTKRADCPSSGHLAGLVLLKVYRTQMAGAIERVGASRNPLRTL